MREVRRELGALIREYRVKKELTQLHLAQRLGYDSTQFVSLFERGLSKVPHNVLGQLIVILGIPEKKVLDTLMKAYEVNLKSEISSGKKTAKNSA
ncbi:MAG: helix-turn-helix domain-containing protein [Bdellovibrionaceae bacterium]|nr:helix-turn-helix domain-containing protein [Pseudobdellovibrionaceae bacterium]